MTASHSQAIKAHILLVDDSRDNIFFMSKTLDFFGCTYHTAQNGEESFKMARENEYDFILMDIQMPVMNGFIATRLIRAWEKTAQRRKSIIIGMTGSGGGTDESYFRETGMDDYIIKPFKIQELKEKLCGFKQGG